MSTAKGLNSQFAPGVLDKRMYLQVNRFLQSSKCYPIKMVILMGNPPMDTPPFLTVRRQEAWEAHPGSGKHREHLRSSVFSCQRGCSGCTKMAILIPKLQLDKGVNGGKKTIAYGLKPGLEKGGEGQGPGEEQRGHGTGPAFLCRQHTLRPGPARAMFIVSAVSHKKKGAVGISRGRVSIKQKHQACNHRTWY